MKRCPSCATTYDASRSFCPQDGTALDEVGAGPGPDQPLDTTPIRATPAPARAAATGGLASRTSALTPDEAVIGQVVADRYQIVSLIGRGGMGVVYRARHLTLGRHLAIKFLRHQFINDDRAVGRFMREAHAMARIDHPNAAHVYDFGVLPSGVAYLAMEMIEGEPLRSVLARSGPLPVEDVLAVVEQVCGAVEAAHREGVIHRDLKPENIMLKSTEAGAIVKVVDFGLAKVADATDSANVLTAAGELFGTPAYMAPEFFQGDEIDGRADVYALGAITYEILTGAPPFQGTVQTVIGSQLFKDPPPIAAARPDVTTEIARAVALALRKDPKERPATARAYAAMLRGSEEPSTSAGLPAAIPSIEVMPVAEVAGVVTPTGNSSAVTVSPVVRATHAQPGETSEMDDDEAGELLGEKTAEVDLTEEALRDAELEAEEPEMPTIAVDAPARRPRGAAIAVVSIVVVVSLVAMLVTSFRATAGVAPSTPAPAAPAPVRIEEPVGETSVRAQPPPEPAEPEGDAPAAEAGKAKPSKASARPKSSSSAKAGDASKKEQPKSNEKQGKQKKRKWYNPLSW